MRASFPELGGAPCIELDGNRSIVITGRCVIALYSREEMLHSMRQAACADYRQRIGIGHVG